MKILIIRHGESGADLLNVYEGRADFDLTPRGHEQAEAMARWVCARHTLNRLYCSPLKRAWQTADHLARHAGLTPVPEEELMEFNNGLIAGMDREEANRKYPPVQNLPLHAAVYEQESRLEFRMRAERMLSRLMSENDDNAVVAVVSHGGMINQLYRAFLRLPPDCDILFATGDTGVHLWQIADGKRRVLMSNFTGHAEGI